MQDYFNWILKKYDWILLQFEKYNSNYDLKCKRIVSNYFYYSLTELICLQTACSTSLN